jgi:cytochrome c-type biogenesis protein CcmH/NrfG
VKRAKRAAVGQKGAKARLEPEIAAGPKVAPTASFSATVLAAGAILVPAALVYYNSFQGPFIFDDDLAIVNNATIGRLWPLGRVLLSPIDDSAISRRPVTNLSVAINYAAGGLNVWGYHFFNVAAHALAGLALFGVIRRTLRRPLLREQFGAAATALALITTLIWTVHPLQTNAVTYIIQRTEVLAGLFYLLTLYCVIRGAEGQEGRGQGTGDRGQKPEVCPLSPVPCPLFPVPFLWYAAAVVSCLLAMGSKESAVSAPVVVLVYDRLFLSGSWREVWRRRGRLYLGLAATWSLTAVMLGRDWLSPRTDVVAVAEGRFSPWLEYALLQFRSIAWYLRLCFWPSPLILDYGKGHVSGWGEVAPYAALVLALVWLTAAGLRWRPALGFLGLWFFAILAPSSGLVPITPECAAEKRMYLPLAAVAVLVVAGAYGWGQRWLAPRRHAARWRWAGKVLGFGLAAEVVAALALLSVCRNDDYRTELGIWQDTVDKRPDNARAQGNLATQLWHLGNMPEAIRHYQRSLELDPDNWLTHSYLGLALEREGRMPEAIGHYQRALQLKPNLLETHDKLGPVVDRGGMVPEAISRYRQAIRPGPADAKAYSMLASLLKGDKSADGGDPAATAAAAEQVCRQSGDPAGCLDALAAAYAAAGRFPEAVAVARKAVQLASAAGNSTLARQIEQRRALYAERRASGLPVSPAVPEADPNMGVR